MLLLVCSLGVPLGVRPSRAATCRGTDVWRWMPRSSSGCAGALVVPEGDVWPWGAVYYGMIVGGEAREGPPFSDGG